MARSWKLPRSGIDGRRSHSEIGNPAFGRDSATISDLYPTLYQVFAAGSYCSHLRPLLHPGAMGPLAKLLGLLANAA